MKELLKRKSVKIALFAITLIVVAGIAGINVQSAQKDKEYNRHMDAAERYLSELDYEQAIAEYILALEIESKEEVLDALEKTYLAYAQAVVDKGDLERAIAILQEGYAVTGRESLKEKISELEDAAKAPESGDAEDETMRGIIEIPFEVSDITIKGYDLLSDHYNEIIGAYGCPPPGVENGYTLSPDGVCLSFFSEGTSCQIWEDNRTLNVQPPAGASRMSYQVWTHENLEQRCFVLWGEPSGSWADYGVNLPVDLQSSYDDWCQVMQVGKIKEAGEKIAIEPGSFGEGGESWNFQTKWGRGVYSELLLDNGGSQQFLTLYGKKDGSWYESTIYRIEGGNVSNQIGVVVLHRYE